MRSPTTAGGSPSRGGVLLLLPLLLCPSLLAASPARTARRQGARAEPMEARIRRRKTLPFSSSFAAAGSSPCSPPPSSSSLSVGAGFLESLLSLGSGGGGGRVKQLVDLARRSDRGRDAERNALMVSLIDELRAEMKPMGIERLKKSVNGSWVEMWTTEEAVLSFANKGFFGASFDYAGGSIDMYNDVFTNVVAFQNGDSVQADGNIQLDESNNRVKFRFNIAKINIRGFSIPLPFSAGGYIDNVYVDDKYRIGVDSRGDYRVYRRPGVPA